MENPWWRLTSAETHASARHPAPAQSVKLRCKKLCQQLLPLQPWSLRTWSPDQKHKRESHTHRTQKLLLCFVLVFFLNKWTESFWHHLSSLLRIPEGLWVTGELIQLNEKKGHSYDVKSPIIVCSVHKQCMLTKDKHLNWLNNIPCTTKRWICWDMRTFNDLQMEALSSNKTMSNKYSLSLQSHYFNVNPPVNLSPDDLISRWKCYLDFNVQKVKQHSESLFFPLKRSNKY